MNGGLTYNRQTIVPVILDGVAWIRESDIALCLSLDRPQVRAARHLYRGRFSVKTSRILQVHEGFGSALVRLYSSEGASLLATLLLGDRAEPFCLWVTQALTNAAASSALLAADLGIDGNFVRGYECLSCLAELVDELSIHRPHDGGLNLGSLSTLLHTICREFDAVHEAMVNSR